MNGQLPPIDPDLRAHLSRRSAGRLPEGLASQVLEAVDRAPVRPRRSWLAFSPRPTVAPRTLFAGGSLAAVLLLVAAFVVVPRFQVTPAASGPAGYPADGALTTAELASLMAGPALPTNTALVASVTIEPRTDVCPMDSRPTIGVVEGMSSQVCVMGSSVSAYLNATTATGTFAFRYMAPGYLGLIGEITPAASRLAFHVTEDWPLAGKTFLVEAWLGAEGLLVSCVSAPTAGDVLAPNGEDCPYDDWLGDEPTAPGIQADHEFLIGSPEPSYDPLSLRGNARHVEAGGMRLIDSIDQAAPVHGVYVVRAVTEQCPYSSPVDSRGCGVWRVLARVADVGLRASAATPTATEAPTGTYPADRALTTGELTRIMAGPQLAVNTTIVASVTIESRGDACPVDSRPIFGVVRGISPDVCVLAASGAGTPLASAQTLQGIYAFRYLGPGYLGMLGLITPASSTKLPFAVADDWSQVGKTVLVSGWLGATPISCPSLPKSSYVADPLDPDGTDACESSWLTDDPNAAAPTSQNGAVAPAARRFVQAGGMRSIDGISGGSPVHGIFVVRPGNGQPCAFGPVSDPGCPRVLAVVSDVKIPDPGATRAPTSTPAPVATPVVPSGGSSIGLFGTGNRPLTEGEFATLWAADPAHLTGRIAIVKGPLPTGFECWSAGAADVSAPPGTCHIAILDGFIAQEGYWAVRAGADGKLSIVGQI